MEIDEFKRQWEKSKESKKDLEFHPVYIFTNDGTRFATDTYTIKTNEDGNIDVILIYNGKNESGMYKVPLGHIEDVV